MHLFGNAAPSLHAASTLEPEPPSALPESFRPQIPLISRPRWSQCGGPKRVLLVDDDADLRLLTQASLRQDGYDVLACGDGLRAIETARSNPEIDLLLTDFQMPFLTGLELAEACCRAHPDLPVIVISGSIMSQDHIDTMRHHHWHFLPKPFRIPLLLNLVREAVTHTARFQAV